MRRQSIVITQKDMSRLANLIEAVRFIRPGDEDHLSALERELDRAEIIYDDSVPPTVITMNSHVRVTDLDTGREHEYNVVYPREADPSRGKISVLAPLGTALLGYSAGSRIEWIVPGGLRRLRVEEVSQGDSLSASRAA